MRTEATRSALTFKTAVDGEGCVALEALYPHGGTTSHPSGQAGAPLSQHNWGSFSDNPGTAQVRRGHSVKISSFADSKSYLLPQDMKKVGRAFHTLADCVAIVCLTTNPKTRALRIYMSRLISAGRDLEYLPSFDAFDVICTRGHGVKILLYCVEFAATTRKPW